MLSCIRGSARIGTLRDIASGRGPAPGPPRERAESGQGHDGDGGEDRAGDEGESWFAGGERR